MTSHLDQLVRWEESGGHWRVLQRTATEVTVGLFTCDGGTEMSRLTAPGVELDGFLAGRSSSEDAGDAR